MRSGSGRGRIFVVSAPSGCGKTTLCKRLLADGFGLADSVSMTTRPPRRGEVDGVDYRFVSEPYFARLMRRGAFLEYEENFGNRYGTPKAFVERSLSKGRPVLLSIDVKGAMKVKRAYPGESVLIFIVPPSMKALKERLHGRRSDPSEVIRKRLALARQELAYRRRYDYSVVNDDLDRAYGRLRRIVLEEMESCGCRKGKRRGG
jgi:guanylate kinase